jgi:transcriptional regulator with XRE-family HTH domain
VVAGPSLGDDRPRPFAQRLAGEIRRLRKAAGLSQPQLAALIGYTRQYVSLAERPNRGLPSAELVRAIDDALRAGGALATLRQQADTERKACRPATSPNNAAAAAGTGRATTEDLLITRQGTPTSTQKRPIFIPLRLPARRRASVANRRRYKAILHRYSGTAAFGNSAMRS